MAELRFDHASIDLPGVYRCALETRTVSPKHHLQDVALKMLGSSLADPSMIIPPNVAGGAPVVKFPAPQPCSIDRSDFPKLKEDSYFVSEKIDGLRVLIMFCRFDGKNFAVFFDRCMTPHLLRAQKVPKQLFQGTLLDCELAAPCDPSKPRVALVFDALVVAGIPVYNERWSVRMSAARRGLTHYAFDPSDTARIVMKEFLPAFLMNGGEFVQRYEAMSKTFKCDGVILQPENEVVRPGRCRKLFKWKESCEHTVDFKLMDAKGRLGVYHPLSKRHTHVAQLCQESLVDQPPPGCVVECAFVGQGTGGGSGVWKFVRVRGDKVHANDKTTFEKTLVNITEGVTLLEISSFFMS
jgi:hypothetical protein